MCLLQYAVYCCCCMLIYSCKLCMTDDTRVSAGVEYCQYKYAASIITLAESTSGLDSAAAHLEETVDK